MQEKNRSKLNEWIRMIHSFNLIYYRFLKRYGLSMNSFHILILLKPLEKGMEPSLIAENLGLLRQALAPLLNGLETRHLIVRLAVPGDHRKKRIVLTEQGRTLATEVEKLLSTLEIQALDGLDENDSDKMFEGLRQFNRSLDQLIQ